MSETTCPGCGALLPVRAAPTHRYMESSPACWALYGEVLAREYSDPAFFVLHRLTVDAYAAQHPGQPSPQSIQSVAVHLIRLCLLSEQELSPERANAAMLAAVAHKERYVWMTPPVSLGALTIKDVHEAADVEEHLRRVRAWAKSVWEAWSPHYATIRGWLPKDF